MKDLSVSLLLDVYGCLLGEKQYRIAVDYYNEDLSLSEISENESMSRQAAHDMLKRTVTTLYGYEEKLHYLETVNKLKKAAEENDTKTLYSIIESL